MRLLLRSALVITIMVTPSVAGAAPASQSCSAADLYKIATFGSRHCEITLACPSGGAACSWRLAVSISGIGTVHAWIDGQQVDCSGVNTCSASKTFSLGSGQARTLRCFMQGDPVIAINASMTCSGTGL